MMILAAFVVCGCQRAPSEVAAAGSAPAVSVPVGHVPGPAAPALEPTNPFGQNPVALTEGRTLFVHYNCYGCHGGHAGGGMGPSLRDPVWIYGSSDAHIFDSIAQGRANGMPAWGTQIPQEQIWKLVAYIKSMRTPNEPEPPE
jgi:cytochrome c oxidase cbb3-type subunit III